MTDKEQGFPIWIKILTMAFFIFAIIYVIFFLVPQLSEGHNLQVESCKNKSNNICEGSPNFDYCYNETLKLCYKTLNP